MRSLILWIFSLGLLSSSWATDLSAATENFRSGNQAYEKGEFTKAEQEYQKAISLGASDSRLYFNYGNTLFRLNRLGPAVLYYEKAFKISPDDEDIAFNLRYARATIVDKIPEPEPNLLTRILWALHTAYSIRAGIWLSYALYASAFGLAIARLFLSGLLRTFALTMMILSLMGLVLVSPSLAYKIHQYESTEFCIVMQPMIEVYSGPGENYQVLIKIHEGTKVEVVENQGEWLSVKLANGKGGFVRTQQLGKV